MSVRKIKARTLAKMGWGVCTFSGRTTTEIWKSATRVIPGSIRMTVHEGHIWKWRLPLGGFRHV